MALSAGLWNEMENRRKTNYMGTESKHYVHKVARQAIRSFVQVCHKINNGPYRDSRTLPVDEMKSWVENFTAAPAPEPREGPAQDAFYIGSTVIHVSQVNSGKFSAYQLQTLRNSK